MDKDKAKHFNDSASRKISQSEKIIQELNISLNDIVIDFGSGGGYYTNKFAEIVGENGIVYAIDNNKDLLDYVKSKSKLDNIKPILFSGQPLPIEEGSVNLIFMRNVTHHLKKRTDIFKSLKKLLKTDGKITVIDYKKGKLFSFHGIFGHSVKKEKIIAEMKNAGFKVFKSFNFIEHQHFTIFEKV